MKVNQPAESNGNVQGVRDSTNPPDTDNRTVVELCDAYLSTLHSGAWGRTFYIHDANGRRSAAEFLARTIEGVMDHAKSK